jgi:hypothetical protein
MNNGIEEADAESDRRSAPQDVRRRHWLLALIRRSFKRSWEKLTPGCLQQVYGTDDQDEIARRLIRLFARNASILGAFTGVLMSVDEIAAFATGGEGGVGLPVNILIAVVVLSLETVMLIRFQLALVACMGRLYGAPLDPDDPEDILSIFAYAAGGTAANAAGAAGMKVGGKLAFRVTRSVVQREAMVTLRNVAERVGIRILQLAVVKYALPLVSIGIGMVANFFTTRAIGRIAKSHMQERAAKAASRPAHGVKPAGSGAVDH